MKKINIFLLNTVVGCSLSSIMFGFGYLYSKKKYSPKKLNGELYIDYNTPNYPDLYLNNVDEEILKKEHSYVIFKIHYTKKDSH